MKTILFSAVVALSLLSKTECHAQGLAVNTDGSAANASALLDVKSTTQGILIPRMTNANVLAITSPVIGLLVYQTDGTPGFYYYDGASWVGLSIPANVTTQGNTFNGASQLVQLNGSGVLPAIGANALTNLNAANISGVIPTGNLGTGTATTGTYLQGNGTWATPSTAPSGAAGGNLGGSYPNPSIASLPAISGAALTSLTAANISGVIPTGNLGTGTATTGTYLQGNGTWATPSGAPSGAAGGNLGGSYPNPSIASLPAISGAALTNLSSGNISGVIPTGNLGTGTATTGTYLQGNGTWATPSGAPSGTAGGNLGGTYPNPSIASLPAISGAALTNLTGANITGTVPAAHLGSGTTSSTTTLHGDNTWQSEIGQTFVAANVNSATATLMYISLGGGNFNATYGVRETFMPVACTFDALYVSATAISAGTGAPADGITVTLYVNGAATALSTTVTTAASSVGTTFTASDTGHSVAVAAGSTVALGFTQSNSAPSVQFNVSTHCH